MNAVVLHNSDRKLQPQTKKTFTDPGRTKEFQKSNLSMFCCSAGFVQDVSP